MRANRVQLTLHLINLCLENSIFNFNFFVYFFLFVHTLLMLVLGVDDFIFCWFFYLAYIVLQWRHILDESSLLLQLLLCLGKLLLLFLKFFLKMLVLILELKWCKMIPFSVAFFRLWGLLEIVLFVCWAHSLSCVFYLFWVTMWGFIFVFVQLGVRRKLMGSIVRSL